MGQNKLLVLLGFLLLAVCLSPIIRSSLYSDDIHDYQLLHAYQPALKPSALSKAKDATNMGICLGRFAPLSLGLQEILFYYVPSVKAYKLLVFIFNLLAVASFIYLLYNLNWGAAAAVWLVFYGAVMQFRTIYHDAYTSMHIMFPLLSIYMFLSLAFYCKYIRSSKYWHLAVSVIFYAAAHLASELGLALVLLLVIIAWVIRLPMRKALLSFIPFAMVSLIYVSIVWWVRSHTNTTTYSGLNANIELNAMWQVLIKQLYGSLPLSALHKQGAIPAILLHQLNMMSNILAVIGIFVGCFIVYLYKIGKRNPVQFNKRIVLFAVGLTISPAVFIMPSLKYQQELHWGMAYLPVYIQAFGTATLLTCVFFMLYNARLDTMRIVGKVLFALSVITVCVTFLFNNALIDRVSFVRGKPAEAMFASVQHGILNPCETGSTILLTRDFIWRAPRLYDSMFTRMTGKDFIVSDAELWQPTIDSPSGTCYILDCEPGNPVVTSLFSMNCNTAEKIELLATDTFPCNIKLIPAEENIVYR